MNKTLIVIGLERRRCAFCHPSRHQQPRPPSHEQRDECGTPTDSSGDDFRSQETCTLSRERALAQLGARPASRTNRAGRAPLKSKTNSGPVGSYLHASPGLTGSFSAVTSFRATAIRPQPLEPTPRAQPPRGAPLVRTGPPHGEPCSAYMKMSMHAQAARRQARS